jgi:predicted TIM-barrel fold metal-dependent hydrolase
MDNLPIVDAHHHLWDLENEKTKYSWLMVKEGEAFFGDYGAIRKSYKLENYLNDAKNQNLIK